MKEKINEFNGEAKRPKGLWFTNYLNAEDENIRMAEKISYKLSEIFVRLTSNEAPLKELKCDQPDESAIIGYVNRMNYNNAAMRERLKEIDETLCLIEDLI